jgi:alkanesulfonate monooxygenase SsuD/methylene tetrahydromethanopterin reductase-like flavin-dependent oxidoreductase (luciferase family)
MARHPWVAMADEGVRFGIQAFAPRGDEDPVAALMDAAAHVESLGFDGFFIGDHPSRVPDPWVILGGIAITTDRIMLGSVVNCVFYRNPAHLARLAADLDHLSWGRLMLGLGIGWDEKEFRALSVPFLPVPERQAALEEALEIIDGVWGDELFSYRGEYFSVEEMRVAPGPFGEFQPPLMVAGGGERRTLRQVARFADASNFGPSATVGGAATPEQVRHKLDVLRGHCDDVGRPEREILKTYFTGCLTLAETEAELEDKLDDLFPNGRPGPDFLLAGTPDQIAAYYQERADAGIQYFVVQLTNCTDHETLELLADEVVPQIG